ncbi:NAD-dependent epimerase/dehydratase family protein [Nocardia africana]|uniref:NADH-flavin reductase n=1 Tax=Nocardia africana TaxID=134964 RepID=A0A378WXF3_9NOCA|nr:NAD-dependent epimerase/dehydratase family protein [Nocardia africana]MCC3312685.1 NAD-dependent epimerase/dehydratase family protein [Nocardia africana]SUA45986.1 Putative NADH-flavin reductase [Nocardia africana]
MRIAITGASGNVGTALLRALPDAEIVAVARRPPPAGREPYARARWVACDIGDPAARPTLAAAFEGVDAVVHLAWAVHPRRTDPPLERTNRVGTDHVLGAVADSGVAHLTVASSVAAYSPAPRWTRVDEHQPRGGVPGGAYSLDKVALERRLDAFAGERPAVGLARIRPCGIAQADAAAELGDWLLGPWLPRSPVGRSWLPVPLWPRLRLQLVHAEDVAAAIRAILVRRATGAFDLAAEPVLTAPELTEIFGGFRIPVPLPVLSAAAFAGWRIGLLPLHPSWLRLADRACLVRAERARRELDWRPTHSAVDVATELAAALRARTSGGSPALNPEPMRCRPGCPTHQDQRPEHRTR